LHALYEVGEEKAEKLSARLLEIAGLAESIDNQVMPTVYTETIRIAGSNPLLCAHSWRPFPQDPRRADKPSDNLWLWTAPT